MKIGIVGPVSLKDISHLLYENERSFVGEMQGSSLLGLIIEKLVRLGYVVSVFTTEPTLNPKEQFPQILNGINLKVYLTPLRRYGFRKDRGVRGRMLDFFKLERSALKSAILKDKPDILHAHWTYEFAWAALSTNIPTLVTCHDAPWRVLQLMPDLYRFCRLGMAYIVLKKAHHLTAVSPYLLPELSKFTKRKISVIANPVPSALILAGKVRDINLRYPYSIRVAMILNGWSNLKNPTVGMLALSMAKKSIPNLVIDLIGPDFGPDQKAYEWAARHGIHEEFNFIGKISYKEVQNRLIDVDLLVHPSLEESFGMTVAEAMALGIPIVAGKSSGALPWIMGDGVAGMLVDVTSVHEVTKAIISLVMDSEIYSRASIAGLNRAKSMFFIDDIVDQYLNLYQSINDTLPQMKANET